MSKIKPRTLSGFMELLPSEQALFDKMVSTLRRTYALYGFTALDTPVIEAAEVLLAKGGGETEKQIYRFTKGDTDLALRFDLTVPLAKYVALNAGQLAFPFRRFQIGKVYRGERAQRGRFREFYQADIDVIGDGALDIVSDAEMPSIIYRAFTALGLKRFVIRINNRKLLSGLFTLMGVESEKAGEVMRIIDKLEKIGADKVAALLVEQGLEPDKASSLLDLLSCAERGEDPLERLSALSGQNEQFDAGLNELQTVFSLMASFGVPETHYMVDLTIARGLDYYTGTVYETQMLDHPEIGSICSGGRYDNLAEYYTDKKLPGVGLSIGLTRLFFVLQDQGYLSSSLLTAPTDVLVIPMTEDLAPAVRLATALREGGLRTQIYSENKKFKARMQYADRLGVPFVVFLGEDEIQSGKITVKDMSSGEQTTASPTLLISGMQKRVAALRDGAPIQDKE